MASTGVDLDLTLSEDLLSSLLTSGTAGNGVNVYAVLFGSSDNTAEYVAPLVQDGTAVISTGTSDTMAGTIVSGGSLFNDGTVDSAVDYNLSLVANGDTLDGGKLYIVVQSADPGDTSLAIEGSIASQSFINATNAETYDFSYDSFETTLDGTATDAANLTSVNGFALPMELSATVDGSTSSVGYNVPGESIVSGVTANAGSEVETYFTSGGLDGDFRSLTSPTDVNLPGTAPSTTEPYAQAGWASYILAMETIAPSVTISGQFLGAPDAAGMWHNAGYYAYTLTYDGTNFWLVPTSTSQIQGVILLTVADIEENIFSQVGSVSIYSGASTSDTLLATVGVGDNTQWGAILAQFLTGFTAGYYGQAGQELNAQITGSVNLDQNNNWNPTYAFRQDTETVVSSGTGYAFDPYSEVFYKDSNSYGSPYSDALMSQYTSGGPLLNVANSSGTDASTLDLTIFGQDETPSGYTTPTIYDYIAPTTTVGGETVASYAIPDPTIPLASLTFSFYSQIGANAGIVLDPDSTIAISFLSSDANDGPVWNTVTIDGAGTYTVDGTPFTDPGLWHIWTIESIAGEGWIAVPAESGGSLIDQNDGSMVVNLPVADSGVSWYQVTVGAGTDDAKTYNLYTTTATVPAGTDINGQTSTVTTEGVFTNPAYTGQAAAQAVDGLATVSGTSTTNGATQYTNTLTVNFATGTTVSYNPNLVVENTGSNSNQTASGGYPSVLPAPPVVLVTQNGTLGALAGTVIAPGTYSPVPTIAGTVTSLNGELQLGWAGYDTNDVTVSETVAVDQGGSITDETITGYGWTGSEAVQENLPIGSTLISTGSITNLGSYTDQTNAFDDAMVTVQNSLGQEVTLSIGSDVNGDWLSKLYDFGEGTYTLTMYDAVDNNGTLTEVTGPSDELILNVESGGGGAADNEVVIACFAQGTHLATPGGAVAVEDLAVGDAVLTADGQHETVQWIGFRHVDCARHPNPAAVWPVCIAAGAFGPEMPARDLFLSPDHAIYAEGVLVPVKHLVNDTCITQQPVPRVTYFHVELRRHDVLLAEGLPAESYLDTGDRASFANGAGFITLHPAWGSAARDVALFLEVAGYAPLTVAGPAVDRLRARLSQSDSATAVA